MAPHQSLRTHNLGALGSPLLAIGCPFCPRHFHNRSGRTNHIRARHQVESELHEPNPSVPPSPILYPSSHPPSPIPSNHMSPSNHTPPPHLPPPPSNYSPPPSNYSPPSPFNYVLPHADYIPSSVSDHFPPPSDGGFEITALNLDAEDDLDAAPGMDSPQVPDASSVTRAYHPKLDGRVDLFLGLHQD
jgi:hypothetical protein